MMTQAGAIPSPAEPVSTPESNVEVLGPFISTWQSLDPQTGEEPDEARSMRVTAQGGLRDELGLIANADNLVVLAGSGTSLGLKTRGEGDAITEAPRMADLWASVSERDAFKAVRDRLTAGVVAERNLEHVLSDAQARLALHSDDSELKTFVEDAEALVWQMCDFVRDATNLETHELFLRKVARRSTRLQRTQIFTTNYDLAFETAARRSRFSVIDGFGYGGRDFDGGSFDLDYVRRRPNEPLALEPNVFHLLKLHGSVDWDSSSGSVRKVFQRPKQPVLIYPSAAKYQLSYQQPYLEFMSRFQIALRQPDVGLLVIGFGFNDEHLVAPVEAAIRSNIGLRAAVVTPGVRDTTTRGDAITWFEDLIVRGDRRLTLMKGTFADLARHLPDVPPTEERDAHAARVAARSRTGVAP
jgi:SIR2-like domain